MAGERPVSEVSYPADPAAFAVLARAVEMVVDTGCRLPEWPLRGRRTATVADFTEPDFNRPLSASQRRAFLANFSPPSVKPQSA